MTDYLLLAGVALCLISVVAAIVQLIRLQPPRGAAIMLILGIAAIFASAYLDPDPFQPQDVLTAWDNLSAEATAP
ncbi:hypothetical protein [Paracoccus spongiarum]|uniref:Uncharacterized protein n=1 Tax=Paracoccus spongiarum TaxID=3064387 RepID=A0ABT9JBR6_9RHOB|nr:hypothetical protein [Paracoccus sp. 2205BS29-5]MDP5307160.1 hypothetical protein [Paracoccus sp. 2205BS29-5]